ncbi:cytochrome P450 [Mycena olivaceomarginata]|nr:cytochrome P450 [Mycena olivaceomarginata]
MFSRFNGAETSWIALLALTNHLYFNRYEPKSANVPLLVLTIEPILLLFALAAPVSLFRVLSAYIVFGFTLCSSIIIYRISPFILSLISQHTVNKALHDKYGPFLRTGPNEVSIIHVDAVKAVLGTGGFQKGQYYEPRVDPALKTRSLLSLRGEPHANRRRIWNRGLSSESLKDYESILAKRVTQLSDRLEGLSGPVDIAEWFSYFTFDFMGDMAFGGGFEMLRDGGDKEGLWTIIENGAKSVALVCHIPWLVQTLYLVPMATRVKDLWYHLMDEAGMEKQKPTLAEVVADGVLSIIAGSDTTSIAIGSFVWFILRNPDIYRRVQAEVDSVYADGDSLLDALKHDELRFLTACLNETMRLHPPVPTNGTRQVPRGGGRMIAGRTRTSTSRPTRSIAARRTSHLRQDKFDPDRWLRPQTTGEVLNMAAFIPFSYGAANCVGKPLAWREMLMVTSTLLRKFNLRFADGFDSDDWLGNLHDAFITSIDGPLLVEISRR